MALQLYRRHSAQCSKQYPMYDRSGDRCDCVYHVEGRLGDYFVRASTKTRFLSKAREIVVDAERRGNWHIPKFVPISTPKIPIVKDAIRAFMDDRESPNGKNLAAPTLAKYATILGRLEAFCETLHLTTIDKVTSVSMDQFKSSWKTGPRSTANDIVRLKAFFKFCMRKEWITKNPAANVDPPTNYEIKERMPYTEDQMASIMEASRTVKIQHYSVTNFEVETFIMVMRHAGLAIVDATFLQISELVGDELRLYRKKARRNKNKILVVVPIPEFLISRLMALQLKRGRYFFLHGSERISSAVAAWHRRIGKTLALAGVVGSSHRFRHTFATDLLRRHVPIEIVSRLLGHSSIAITQRHYSHWLEDRIKANSDVLRSLYASSSASS